MRNPHNIYALTTNNVAIGQIKRECKDYVSLFAAGLGSRLAQHIGGQEGQTTPHDDKAKPARNRHLFMKNSECQ